MKFPIISKITRIGITSLDELKSNLYYYVADTVGEVGIEGRYILGSVLKSKFKDLGLTIRTSYGRLVPGYMWVRLPDSGNIMIRPSVMEQRKTVLRINK